MVLIKVAHDILLTCDHKTAILWLSTSRRTTTCADISVVDEAKNIIREEWGVAT
jgi:hypothetical protein